ALRSNCRARSRCRWRGAPHASERPRAGRAPAVCARSRTPRIAAQTTSSLDAFRKERAQFNVRLVRRLLGRVMAARQHLPAHVGRPFTPGLDWPEAAVDVTPLAP